MSHPVIMVMIKEEEEKECKPMMMITNEHETFAVLQYTRSVVTKLSGRSNSNRILIVMSITRIRKLHILLPLQLQLQLD